VGQFESFDIENIDRLNHGMNGVLIAEILIEFTISALIVVGAGSKFDATLHVMDTGLLPGRQLSKAILPVDNFSPATGR
jgi:hypothetical protein